MARLNRITLIQFGSAIGNDSSFGQFGSKRAGVPQFTKNIAVIQELPAWQQGWPSAVVAGDKAAYIEDMDSWCLVHSYELAYVFQAGIPEWDPNTVYYLGSYVTQPGVGGGGRWFCISDNVGAGQSGNPPPVSASDAFWRWDNPPQLTFAEAPPAQLPIIGGILKVQGASQGGPLNSWQLTNSLLSDDSTNIIIGGVAGTNGIKFPDGSVQKTAAVSPQAVTMQSGNLGPVPAGSGQRVIGGAIPYMNPSGPGSKPRYVAITLATTGTGGAGVVVAKCDTTAAPSVEVGRFGASGVSGGAQGSIFFIVLPGYNYWLKVTADGVAIESWIEWT